mmetsp:Transcript_28838/g.59043  ORF Transcript_28838/g.59043 Transcript_28838/m.59043 type:complete len:97 (+) Transcript_28838:932-1222(+)
MRSAALGLIEADPIARSDDIRTDADNVDIVFLALVERRDTCRAERRERLRFDPSIIGAGQGDTVLLVVSRLSKTNLAGARGTGKGKRRRRPEPRAD